MLIKFEVAMRRPTTNRILLFDIGVSDSPHLLQCTNLAIVSSTILKPFYQDCTFVDKRRGMGWMSESEIAIGLRLARDGKEMESASLQILCVGRARLGVVLPVCMPRGF